MAVCEGCSRPIRWVTTTAGKAMPIDPYPVDNGNVVPVKLPAGGALARVLTGAELTTHDGPRYRSHFASCPEAAHYRRRRTSS